MGGLNLNALVQIMPLAWWGISVVAILAILGIIFYFILNKKIKRFESAYLALQTFATGKNLDTLLQQYIETVNKLDNHLSECEARLGKIEDRLKVSIDRAELLRFNAFENMGSDLSFALALMNEEGDGVVLSSIHNREESRFYAKPVKAGESTYHLSEEERKVISAAKNHK